VTVTVGNRLERERERERMLRLVCSPIDDKISFQVAALCGGEVMTGGGDGLADHIIERKKNWLILA
jgi:hypothetical protein